VKIRNIAFRFWWERGDFITYKRLSYGQKRLLTFFYYLASNPRFVVADELVNGLHYHWIAASVEAIGERQAFLTSQNPLLFDYLPLTSPEEVRSSFVLCRKYLK
jgi:ABC-type molybdenum transport system ATPase subunit/photorepair protein PhrA